MDEVIDGAQSLPPRFRPTDAVPLGNRLNQSVQVDTDASRAIVTSNNRPMTQRRTILTIPNPPSNRNTRECRHQRIRISNRGGLENGCRILFWYPEALPSSEEWSKVFGLI